MCAVLMVVLQMLAELRWCEQCCCGTLAEVLWPFDTHNLRPSATKGGCQCVQGHAASHSAGMGGNIFHNVS